MSKTKLLKFSIISAIFSSSLILTNTAFAEIISGDAVAAIPLRGTPVEFINNAGQVVASTITGYNGNYSVNLVDAQNPLLVAVKINNLGDYLYSLYEPGVYTQGLKTNNSKAFSVASQNHILNITPFTTTLVYSIAGDHTSLAGMSQNLINHISSFSENINIINNNLNRLFMTKIYQGTSILNGSLKMYNQYNKYLDIPLYRDSTNLMVNTNNDIMLKLHTFNGNIVAASRFILPITNLNKYTNPNAQNTQPTLQTAINDTPQGGLVLIPSGTYTLRSYSPVFFNRAKYPDGNYIHSALTIVNPDITIAGSEFGNTILKLGSHQKMRLLTVGPDATNTTLFNLSFNGNKLKEYTKQAYPSGNVVDTLVANDSTQGFTAQFTAVYDSLEDGYGLGGTDYIVNSNLYENGYGVSGGMGITFFGVKNAVLDNDSISDNNGAGVWLDHNSQDIQINNDIFMDNYDGGINASPESSASKEEVKNVYINNDQFNGNGFKGYGSIYLVNAKGIYLFNPTFPNVAPGTFGVIPDAIGGSNDKYYGKHSFYDPIYFRRDDNGDSLQNFLSNSKGSGNSVQNNSVIQTNPYSGTKKLTPSQSISLINKWKSR